MQGHPMTMRQNRAQAMRACEDRKPYEPFEPVEFYSWWRVDLEELPTLAEMPQGWELLQIEPVPTEKHLPTWLRAAAALFEHVESHGGQLALARTTLDGQPHIATYRKIEGLPRLGAPDQVS